MWICPRCNAENREANVACDSCGATRSVGRFGSAPPRRPAAAPSPRVSPAPARDPREQEFTNSAVRNEYTKPDMDVRARPVRHPALTLAKLLGILLCTALPLLVAVLLWRQYDVYRPVMESLLLLEDAPAWLGTACYIVIGLIQTLVALAPGLWTLLLVRIAKARR